MKINEFEDQLTGAVEKLSDSVVSITSTRFARDPFAGFVPLDGAGSGVIIDKKGYIITNNHVIENAAMIKVNLKDGRVLSGKVIGHDAATDMAVIKVDANDLPFAKLGDSGELKVGQMVMAIGNALGLSGGHSMSMGVVSALGRPLPGTDFIFEGLVQTDAAINPGNSGGALADINGNVIGINTMIIKNAQGVGFAIPINTAKWVVEQLLSKGRVVRPWLGIYGIDVNGAAIKRFDLPTDSGVLIVQTVDQSPAYLSGLRPGDIIKSASGVGVKKMKDLIMGISKVEVGKEVVLTILRNGKEQKIPMKLSEIPRAG
ncbi:trypsin-like peptidase domain-containing protein [Candidatus Micrarchaeota archaeon]|nr:trypsin-like peptidase domain-containing protein [Candidatus Micrarchaeota archaeon]